MLTRTQQPRAESAVAATCRRCGQSNLPATATVCVRCRAQEEVVRHIPPVQRWNFYRQT